MATTERSDVLVLEGGPAERGRTHGEALRPQVQAAVGRFLADAEARMQMPGRRYVERFLAETAVHRAMAAHTPDLVAELGGPAAGAAVAADELLAYNLMDEEWWYSETLRSKCSALAIPARDGRPALLAQTMDPPRPMDGGQV